LAIAGNKANLVLAKNVEGAVVTSVDCTQAELLGIIQHLLDTFAESVGVSYNQVLADLHYKNEGDIGGDISE